MSRIGATLRRICWWFDAQRISWLIFFPLQIYFAMHRRWVLMGVFVLATVVIVTFGETLGNIRIGILYKAKRKEQIKLDETARQCVARLRNSEKLGKPIALFLRPFSADVGMHSRDPEAREGFDPYAIETRLVQALRHEYLCVSLAGPDQHNLFGDTYANMVDVSVSNPRFANFEGRLFYAAPGQVSVPDVEWLETFQLLAKQATLIFSIPVDMSKDSEKSGTIQELLYIAAEQYLPCCVFVMPPEQAVHVRECFTVNGHHASAPGRDRKLSELWETTRGKLASEGLKLPPFADTPDGGLKLFAYRPEGVIIATIPHAVVKSSFRFLEAIVTAAHLQVNR